MFSNLADSMKAHNAYNAPQYRKSLFSLNKDLGALKEKMRHSMNLSSGETSPTGATRPLFIPQQLIDNFIANSFENTENNTETLGILAGTTRATGLYVDTLILPKQSGTPDSCECTDDELLFSAIEQRKLQVLSWVHTHPQHDLFLSSVDVHTHANYQYFLPEAVALVYAPSHPSQLGLFSLTAQGLANVRNCHKGGFHPSHSGDYSECTHVTFSNKGEFTVIDQR